MQFTLLEINLLYHLNAFPIMNRYLRNDYAKLCVTLKSLFLFTKLVYQHLFTLLSKFLYIIFLVNLLQIFNPLYNGISGLLISIKFSVHINK